MTSSVLTGAIRQTLDHFRRSVDQLFENFYGFPAESARAGAMTTGSQRWTFSPAVETAWGDTALNMRVIVPGVSQGIDSRNLLHSRLWNHPMLSVGVISWNVDSADTLNRCLARCFESESHVATGRTPEGCLCPTVLLALDR
jgi:hypothetical protein